MKVCLETMGCQMNALDSELVGSLLRLSGMELTDDARSADVLLYNTCSVRDHAEAKAHSHVGQACQRKRAGRPLVVGVLGCMAQRLGTGLLRQHPGLDIVCGPGQLHRLAEMILAARQGRQVALDEDRRHCQDPAAERLDLGRDPARTHLPGQAYVRIMRGCDKFCAYCVVPLVRGPERSRSPSAVEQEVRRLVDAGVTAVTLLGQTVNSYRHVENGRTVGLADLLVRLDAVAGLRRLRFLTNYPADFDPGILQAMRDLPSVCPYLHLPAQSGSDRILQAMNRRYSRAQYDELMDRARQEVPGVALAGDFIVGFPGEGEEDFAASEDLVRRSRYKNSYVFKYSPRPQTAAQRLGDDVPEQVKRRRNRRLLAVQEEVSLVENRAWIGQTVEVLVEGPSPRAARSGQSPPGQGQLTGRTRTDHIVVFDGPGDLAGRYVSVRILGATALALVAEAAPQLPQRPQAAASR
jgi:tRNA-2-methylthio-N6-dimethylallyladenosine synthase